MQTTARTIHVARDQWHLAWDRSIPPIGRIQSGDSVDFDLLDAAGGQIGPDSTVRTIETLDFSLVDQVNGPIYVEGAAPGDTLQVDILELQPADWGWLRAPLHYSALPPWRQYGHQVSDQRGDALSAG